MGVLGGVFVLKSGLRILIRAPEVPFSVPPKTPKMGVFGYFGVTENGTSGTCGQKSIFCFGTTIFVTRAYHQYIQGYNFPVWTTLKKNSVSELWVSFRGSPRFFAIFGLCHLAIIRTLNFGPQ